MPAIIKTCASEKPVRHRTLIINKNVYFCMFMNGNRSKAKLR